MVCKGTLLVFRHLWMKFPKIVLLCRVIYTNIKSTVYMAIDVVLSNINYFVWNARIFLLFINQSESYDWHVDTWCCHITLFFTLFLPISTSKGKKKSHLFSLTVKQECIPLAIVINHCCNLYVDFFYFNCLRWGLRNCPAENLIELLLALENQCFALNVHVNQNLSVLVSIFYALNQHI